MVQGRDRTTGSIVHIVVHTNHSVAIYGGRFGQRVSLLAEAKGAKRRDETRLVWYGGSVIKAISFGAVTTSPILHFRGTIEGAERRPTFT